MSTEKKSRLAQVDMNLVVSKVLRYGVLLSAALVVIGVMMLLVGARTPNFPDSLAHLIQLNYGKPTLSLSSLFLGMAQLKGDYVIQLGLIVLLATPVIRVAASVVLFAAEKDKLYVVVTLIVLTVLLISIFVVGPFEAGI